MCVGERVDQLPHDRYRILEWQRTFVDQFGKRWPLDELEHQRFDPVTLCHAVDGRDPRMIERREHARFALETCLAFGILHIPRGQDLQRDVTSQSGVTGPIDLAHAATSDGADDLVMLENGARQQRWRRIVHRPLQLAAERT
jgi:hypothetical protein